MMHSSFFYGNGPAYLVNIVHPTSDGRFRHRLRSASSTDYSLPQLRTKFGERAFSHAGPAAWNALPEDIRANHDRAVFRKQLKTHFFTLAFNVH